MIIIMSNDYLEFIIFLILKVIRETTHLFSREKSLYTEMSTSTNFHTPSSTGKKSPQAFFNIVRSV